MQTEIAPKQTWTKEQNQAVSKFCEGAANDIFFFESEVGQKHWEEYNSTNGLDGKFKTTICN